MFFGRFFEVFKFNFVTKSDQVQIYEKRQLTQFLREATSKEKNI
jgi:hypothetical protein